MSDKFRNLSEREQRFETMRRNGEDFRSADGSYDGPLDQSGPGALIRAIWDHDEIEVKADNKPKPARPTVPVAGDRPTPINPFLNW